MKKKTRDRYWVKVVLVMAFFAFGYGAVVYRLYTLQIRDHDLFKEKAERQQSRTVKIVPKRGTIYDSRLRELAISVDTISLYAVPPSISDKPATARALAQITGGNRKTILRKLLKKKHFVWIARKLNPKVIDQLEQSGLEGVEYLYESKRFVPNRSLAAEVLGFVGIDNQGLEGLEFEYDSYVKGEPGWFLARVDARCRKIMAEGEGYVEPAGANHLVLAIDKVIQYITEVELKNAVTDNKARSGMAVMMRPSTGEILSMASYPSFNPNEFQRVKPSRRRNRAILENFEPGSTFKLITLGAALERNAVQRRDIFFCENGEYRFRNTTFHDTHEYGWLGLRQIIQLSSNIGAIKIAERLKAKDFYRMMRDFGFGEKTGVDLSGESQGLLRPVSQWSGLSKASLSMGQELSVTALQVLNAVSTIANRGVRMKPFIVSRIITPEGRSIFENSPEMVKRVISEKTADYLIRCMISVVDEDGTAPQATVPGFTAAGKTGTAQIFGPAIGRYSKSRYVGSFVGFVPADRPEIALIVVVNEPRGDHYYGGLVAAPAFSRIAERTLRYLRVHPEPSSESILTFVDGEAVSLKKIKGSS
jgi:cell division protein FtsI (penicillin-binding protein 3)